MRLLNFFIFILVNLTSFGQDTVSRKDAWDSLFARTSVELKQYGDILNAQAFYCDTSRKKHLIIIRYFSAVGKILQKVSNYLNENNCLTGINYEYYNVKGLLAFRRNYKKCCQDRDTSDYKCFERQTDYERFEYDDKGVLLVHVTHPTTEMTFRETFTYLQDGTRQTLRERIKEQNFWK